MSFNTDKSLSAVLKEFQINYLETNWIIETEFPVTDFFRTELEVLLNEGIVDNSEAAICENLIYPVLKEVWKIYRAKFVLWSHQALTYDLNLSGIPDYIIAKRSPLGKIIFDKPYFVVVEAKKDDFEEGWGQCSAEMIAVQRLNNEPEQTIYGIVSNGKMWQFSKLKNDTYTKNKKFYTIQDLDSLFAAVNYVFNQCELELK